jgi:hypothetical protein
MIVVIVQATVFTDQFLFFVRAVFHNSELYLLKLLKLYLYS